MSTNHCAGGTRDWFLKRNCSLSPRQLGIAYAVLLSTSLTVAALFLLLGAWQILLFSAVEMLAVAVAFLCHARHATDHEHVALTDHCLLVERVLAGDVEQVRLDPASTRVALPAGRHLLVRLQERDVEVQVGAFVSDPARRLFAQELAHELRRRASMQRQAEHFIMPRDLCKNNPHF